MFPSYSLRLVGAFLPAGRCVSPMAYRVRTIGLRYAALGAAATLLVIIGWHLYARWRLGRIELTTDDEPVVVQVLAETSDIAIGEPFDLASRAAAGPAGGRIPAAC